MGSPLAPRRLLAAAALLVLAAPRFAQERAPAAEEPGARAPSDDPDNAVEFAVGGDGLWFAYRNGLHRGDGYFGFGLLVSEDDDLALQVRLMRYGEPKEDLPLGFGIGLGLFGATIDETEDELAALTLIGAADFALDRVMELTYPLRVGVEVSYAPDVATFVDGESVLDLRGSIEVDLSSWATAFVGYRQLEVDLEDEDDVDLDSALHIGVRLGF